MGVAFRRDFGGGTAPDYATTGVEKNSQKVLGFTTVLPLSWQRFSHTFSVPNSAGGLVGVSGTDGPEISFYIRAGTDLVGEDVTEEINPNLAGVNDYKIYLAQVQLEYGQETSLFELNDPTSDFNRCLRYYQTTNSDSPFRNIVDSGISALSDDSIPIEGSRVVVRYPVEIRDPDSCTVTVKTDSTTPNVVTVTNKSKKGFKGTKGVGGIIDINYEVESEI